MRRATHEIAREIDVFHGEPSIMISKCLRGFIKAAPGNTLIGGDFSNVESRGIAWLAGEQWKLEAFAACDANPDLPDMYERAFAKTFNRDPRTVTKEERQIGKVEELAFGYQGGVGAARKMAPRDTRGFSDEALNEWKVGWRAAHPAIVGYWKALQVAAILAVLEPGIITTAGAAGREVRFRKRGSFLWCRLPSGRTLCYPYPVVYTGDFGQFLTFKSVPDATVWAIFSAWKNSDPETRGPNTTYIVDEPTNTREWCRISTYGGKLSENITQAICRDLLADAMLRIHESDLPIDRHVDGTPIVLHVHDEIIVEGKFVEEHRAKFEALMNVVPDWARDFPIRAGCWLSERYRKE